MHPFLKKSDNFKINCSAPVGRSVCLRDKCRLLYVLRSSAWCYRKLLHVNTIWFLKHIMFFYRNKLEIQHCMDFNNLLQQNL